MASADLLRKTVADFFEVDEAQVGPGFPLDGRRAQGSIGRAALDAAIRRRVGVKSSAVYTARTFGELSGESGPPSAPAPAAASPSAAPTMIAGSAGAAACGVDMELVANLPVVADPWEDAFYRAHFAPAEIAYCLLQETPAQHFAARWCAKEALKKCEPALLGADFKDLEVAADESGAPHLIHHAGGGARRLPHAVSLSHTPLAAVAVVVLAGTAAPSAAPMVPMPAVAPPPPARRSSRGLGVLNLLLALTALGLALYRVYRP